MHVVSYATSETVGSQEMEAALNFASSEHSSFLDLDMSAALETSQFQYNDSFKPSKSRKRRKHPTQTPNAAGLYTRCAEELRASSWLDQCHRSYACLSLLVIISDDNLWTAISHVS